MKNLLKLYKMFYRLLRLKDWQRREIETRYKSEYDLILASIYNEYFEVQTELRNYKNVMLRYGISSPLELLKVLGSYPIECNASKAEILMLKDLLKAQYRSQTTINQLSEGK